MCFTSTLKSTFEDIFYRNNVDLVLSSHENLYERLYPIYKNQKELSLNNDFSVYNNTRYPTYVICGASNSYLGFPFIDCNI